MDGKTYRIGKMTAFQQFHVSRKISPLIPPLIPVFMQIAKDSGANNIAQLSALFQPFCEGFAALSDETAEYVISNCLSVVRRRNDKDEFVPIWSTGGKVVMFDDINDLSTLLRLVLRVIQDSLGNFLSGFLSGAPLDSNPAAATAA